MIAALALLVSLLAPSCWRPPVVAPMVRGFEAPPCTWCAGHRGLEYRPEPDRPVAAVAPGVVVFAGPVAGDLFLTVRLADGRRVTYGYLLHLRVRPGERVSSGQVVGVSTARLLLSVRVGSAYVDPAPFIGRWEGRPRLLPVGGATPRPAPMPRFTCASSPTSR